MKGYVDDQQRALLPIRVCAAENDERQEILVWIDTAFTGSLVIPKATASALQLKKESSVEAILADGNLVELETYGCVVEWFGTTFVTQIVTSESEYGLVGTMLLDERTLEIDYRERTVALVRPAHVSSAIEAIYVGCIFPVRRM